MTLCAALLDENREKEKRGAQFQSIRRGDFARPRATDYSSGRGWPFVSGAKASVTMPMRKFAHIVIAA